jgi:hypothetical protein
MPNNWDALKKRLDKVKKPVSAFHLCEDPDIRDRYQAARKTADRTAAYLKSLPDTAAADARALAEQRAADAAAELATAEKAYKDATITLRFTALERSEFEALQNAHPASEQDEADGLAFDMDSFAPALISAASLDGMPIEDATHFLNTWTSADAKALFDAAWSVQHTQRTDLGKG